MGCQLTVSEVNDIVKIFESLVTFLEIEPNDLEFVEEFVQKKLQELIRDTLGSILIKKDFKFIVPSRSSTHTVFKDELCRRLLTRHEITRSYSNTKSQRLCIRTFLVLLIIHERCFINKQRIKRPLPTPSQNLADTRTHRGNFRNMPIGNYAEEGEDLETFLLHIPCRTSPFKIPIFPFYVI
ncbi:hypothetical protein GBA52_003774 [Prunus armeniaca]|nr:hypothetical protein GBA52_003774 [Prunus armeniaca]